MPARRWPSRPRRARTARRSPKLVAIASWLAPLGAHSLHADASCAPQVLYPGDSSLGRVSIRPIGESAFHRQYRYVNMSRLMTADGIRHLIRERIQAGRLPRDHTIGLWHGSGLGQTCDGCGLTITPADRLSLMCAEDWKVIRLHEACFALWDEERRTGTI